MANFQLVQDPIDELGREHVQNAFASTNALCSRHSTLFRELSNCHTQLCQLNAIDKNTNLSWPICEKQKLENSLKIINELVINFRCVSQSLKLLYANLSSLQQFIVLGNLTPPALPPHQ